MTYGACVKCGCALAECECEVPSLVACPECGAPSADCECGDDLFRVACPDGSVRHPPYRNRGDAVCDAKIYDKTCVCRARPHRVEVA